MLAIYVRADALLWAALAFHIILREIKVNFAAFVISFTATAAALADNVGARIFAVIWALFGTGLVLLWVSSAFVLHLAVSYHFRLEKEQSALDLKCVKQTKEILRRQMWRSA